MAFSMFSALPMPQIKWDEKNMRYMLAAFPIVGACQGLIMWGMQTLLMLAGFPLILRSAILCVIPIIYTGGIHMDGFMDVSDALSSNRDREKRLEIMKDPHIGAFAAIALAVYMVLYFGFLCGIERFEPAYFILMPFLSRCLSGLSLLTFKVAPESSLGAMFSNGAAKKATVSILTAFTVLAGAGLIVCGIKGIFILLGAAVMFLIYNRLAEKQFGGTTGDLAGWFLAMCELVMLGVYTMCGYFM